MYTYYTEPGPSYLVIKDQVSSKPTITVIKTKQYYLPNSFDTKEGRRGNMLKCNPTRLDDAFNCNIGSGQILVGKSFVIVKRKKIIDKKYCPS